MADYPGSPTELSVLQQIATNTLGIGTGALTIGAVTQSGTWSVGNVGSTGVDYSANAATIPMSGLVLLTTIPILSTRQYVEVQNQSAATLQLVKDNGSGSNQTTILVAPGAGAGQQGGGWSSSTFKGRIRIYGPTGAQVSAAQE